MKKLLLLVVLFAACENPVENIAVYKYTKINKEIQQIKSSCNKIALINNSNIPFRIKHYSTINICQYGFILPEKTLFMSPKCTVYFRLDTKIYNWQFERITH